MLKDWILGFVLLSGRSMFSDYSQQQEFLCPSRHWILIPVVEAMVAFGFSLIASWRDQRIRLCRGDSTSKLISVSGCDLGMRWVRFCQIDDDVRV